MRWQRGNAVVALFLIACGGWIIAGSLGVPLPGLERIWPAFPIAFGLAMLVQSAGGTPRDEGLIAMGVGFTLSGAFLFLFTLGVLRWSELSIYWPAFPLIAGLSFFALYLRGGMRDPYLLVPAFAVGGLGVIALPFTLGAVENAFINRAIRLWPALVVIMALMFLFRPPRRAQRTGTPPTDSPTEGAAE